MIYDLFNIIYIIYSTILVRHAIQRDDQISIQQIFWGWAFQIAFDHKNNLI